MDFQHQVQADDYTYFFGPQDSGATSSVMLAAQPSFAAHDVDHSAILDSLQGASSVVSKCLQSVVA